ncbi:Orf y [Tanacetum coccineum]
MKKDSKIKQIPGTNISQENIKGCNIFLQISKYKIIEEILDKVCSENPIDPQKTKGWMKATIKLIDPNTVVRVKPMCYSPQDRIEFTKQINELLDMKLIVQSKSPHMSPAFLVENEAEKRRGKKRMVVNYKKINEATIGDSHNLPNMQELLTLLRGKSIFSSFDCKSGFWQVLLDEQSQLLTAFTCPNGHFQWKVVPFGLKQAPSIFQRHMQNALRGLEKFCTVYVDDIIVFSDNKEKHYIHVLEVLKTISKHGIILSKKKANLFKTKINFLGLEIDQGTHSPQKHILEHLHNFPDVLEDKKQLQRYTSGSFKAAEKNCHSNEKELLAVKNVISKFSAYPTPETFLLRSINEQLRVLETPTTVIDVPESESLKTATSPVQTASGKDSTNPLKAEVLLKSLDNTGLGSLNLNSKLAYANPFTFVMEQSQGSIQETSIHEKILYNRQTIKSLSNFIEGSDSRTNTTKLSERKVLKAQDKPIYVKVVSSIPDWNHEENYSPYHFMEIGLAKPNKELQFSKVMEDRLENPFLGAVQKVRNQGLRRIAELILQTITEGNKKVNYADSHCIIISHKTSTEEDINLLNQFGLPFLKNTIEAKGTTKEAYCRQARQLFEEHSCNYCIESKEKEAGPSTSTNQVPTTEDESSSD